MAFDATDAPAEVQARERLMKLRDHIAGLELSAFYMGAWCMCISGHAGRLFDAEDDEDVRGLLGLSVRQAGQLFTPSPLDDKIYLSTPTQAVRVINHLLATGEVDWGVLGEP